MLVSVCGVRSRPGGSVARGAICFSWRQACLGHGEVVQRKPSRTDVPEAYDLLRGARHGAHELVAQGHATSAGAVGVGALGGKLGTRQEKLREAGWPGRYPEKGRE